MQAHKWGRIINVLNTGAKAPRPASAPTSVTPAHEIAALLCRIPREQEAGTLLLPMRACRKPAAAPS